MNGHYVHHDNTTTTCKYKTATLNGECILGHRNKYSERKQRIIHYQKQQILKICFHLKVFALMCFTQKLFVY